MVYRARAPRIETAISIDIITDEALGVFHGDLRPTVGMWERYRCGAVVNPVLIKDVFYLLGDKLCPPPPITSERLGDTQPTT